MVWWHHPNVVSRVIPRTDTTVDVVVVAVSDSPNDTADTAADADTDDDDDEHHYFRYYGHLPPSWSRWPS